MDTTTAPPHSPAATTSDRVLARARDGRMIAGVAAGIARYLGTDDLPIRLAFVALTFIGGAGVPLYLACWLLMPDERSGRSVAGDVTSGLQDWKN